jgi:hypothetical protein
MRLSIHAPDCLVGLCAWMDSQLNELLHNTPALGARSKLE